LKARLQIDKFSGESVNLVLQEIYSTMYISNLVAFICFEADELIEDKTAGRGNKYEQKANRAICISALRRRFIAICLLADSVMQRIALEHLRDDISKGVTYVDKSKSRPRDKRKIKISRNSNHLSWL